jgi:hypothetical protein
MNKLYTLLIAAAMLLSIPAAAQTVQEGTGFNGSATQANGAMTQGVVSYGLPSSTWTGETLNGVYVGSYGVGGSQAGYVGFSSQMTSTSADDETGNGSGYTSGTTVAWGNLIQGANTVGSQANGSTAGNANVYLTSDTGQNSYYMNGSGSLTTGTSALIGNFTVAANGGLSPTNGAFASSATTGEFNFSVSGLTPNIGWLGNGSTVQTGYSQVSNLGNGFSATSTATVTSTACPVVSK